MSGTKKPLTFDIDASPPTPGEISQEKAAAPRKRLKPTEPAIVRQQVGARVKADTYRQLKAHAAIQGRKVQELVEQAIEEFLQRSKL